MKTIIRNATIVNEGQHFNGSVIIEDEMIQQVIQGNDDPSQTSDLEIDATGLYLFPGVIDDHVHFREPGLTHKADIASESRTATHDDIFPNLCTIVRFFVVNCLQKSTAHSRPV